MSRRLAALLSAIVPGAAILLTLTAPPAAAHNVLLGTDPADRASVARTPSEVVLTFNEPALALGTELVVSGPDGPVGQGPPRLVDRTVAQSLAPGAPAGDYTVEWRVTSVDGHPVSGVLHFTASAAGVDEPSAASSPPPVPTAPQAPGWPGWVAAVLVAAVISISLGLHRRRRDRPPAPGLTSEPARTSEGE